MRRAVYMTLNEVPAEAIPCAQRLLQMHTIPRATGP